MGFPVGSVIKKPPANSGDAVDVGSIPGWGRSPRWGNGNPLQSSCLGNPMDRGAWRATVHGVSKSQTLLSNWACVCVCAHTHTHTHYTMCPHGGPDKTRASEFIFKVQTWSSSSKSPYLSQCYALSSKVPSRPSDSSLTHLPPSGCHRFQSPWITSLTPASPLHPP